LISAKIADNLTGTKFIQSWETLAVTVANFGCALFGGIPATAALARTAFNIKTGATSRASGILQALVLFIVSYGALPLFIYFLQPVVAAIVVVVAIKMVDIFAIIHLWKLDKGSFGMTILTMLICIFVNPTFGLLVGAFLSFLRNALQVSYLKHETIVSLDGRQLFISLEDSAQVHVENAQYRSGNILTVSIPGDFTYLNAENFIKMLENIHNEFKAAILDLSAIAFIDSDGIDSLKDMAHDLQSRAPCGIAICGLRQNLEHVKILRASVWFRELEQKGAIFTLKEDAEAWLNQIIHSKN